MIPMAYEHLPVMKNIMSIEYAPAVEHPMDVRNDAPTDVRYHFR